MLGLECPKVLEGKHVLPGTKRCKPVRHMSTGEARAEAWGVPGVPHSIVPHCATLLLREIRILTG
jgi:hypothetical protein